MANERKTLPAASYADDFYSAAPGHRTKENLAAVIQRAIDHAEYDTAQVVKRATWEQMDAHNAQRAALAAALELAVTAWQLRMHGPWWLRLVLGVYRPATEREGYNQAALVARVSKNWWR